MTEVGTTEHSVAERGGPWQERYADVMLGVYGTPQRLLVRGEGCYVWDGDGRRYLDLLAGIATNALGHAHPSLVRAVTGQLSTLGHVSNFFATPPQIGLAERLLGLLGAPEGSRVFFANSGGEANEAAFKMARRTGRPRVLALEGAFHGRSMGALALTHKPAYREPFAPLPGGVEHLPFGDVDALAAPVAETPPEAGRVVVTIEYFIDPARAPEFRALMQESRRSRLRQGALGWQLLHDISRPERYLERARELTAAHGALLVLDEVQTGIGRTGSWFAHTRHGVVPDVVTLAKGLGGGFQFGEGVEGLAALVRVREQQPQMLAVVMDGKGHSFRKELFDGYKFEIAGPKL